MNLRVMTFNLRADCWMDGKNQWKFRKPHVETLLKEMNADIVGLQEVKLRMRKDLESALTQYHWIGHPRTKHPASEQNTLLISKRHQVLDQETFWLSKNPDRIGSSIWYSLFPRICTTAKIKLADGQIVRVYNTHLDCYFSPARSYGLKKIMEYIQNQQEKDPLPLILMGDFNTNPKSPLIQGITSGRWSEQQWVAVQEVDQTLYTKATMGGFKGREKGLHLDYIFVSPHYQVGKTEIIKEVKEGRYPSDHYPLLSEIELKKVK